MEAPFLFQGRAPFFSELLWGFPDFRERLAASEKDHGHLTKDPPEKRGEKDPSDRDPNSCSAGKRELVLLLENDGETRDHEGDQAQPKEDGDDKRGSEPAKPRISRMTPSVCSNLSVDGNRGAPPIRTG